MRLYDESAFHLRPPSTKVPGSPFHLSSPSTKVPWSPLHCKQHTLKTLWPSPTIMITLFCSLWYGKVIPNLNLCSCCDNQWDQAVSSLFCGCSWLPERKPRVLLCSLWPAGGIRWPATSPKIGGLSGLVIFEVFWLGCDNAPHQLPPHQAQMLPNIGKWLLCVCPQHRKGLSCILQQQKWLSCVLASAGCTGCFPPLLLSAWLQEHHPCMLWCALWSADGLLWPATATKNQQSCHCFQVLG